MVFFISAFIEFGKVLDTRQIKGSTLDIRYKIMAIHLIYCPFDTIIHGLIKPQMKTADFFLSGRLCQPGRSGLDNRLSISLQRASDESNSFEITVSLLAGFMHQIPLGLSMTGGKWGINVTVVLSVPHLSSLYWSVYIQNLEF